MALQRSHRPVVIIRQPARGCIPPEPDHAPNGLSVWTRAAASGSDRNVSLPSRPVRIGGSDPEIIHALETQIKSLQIDLKLADSPVKSAKIEKSIGIKRAFLCQIEDRALPCPSIAMDGPR